MVSGDGLPSTGVPASPRLRFRCWRADDVDLAQQLWGDPRVTRWITRHGRLDEVEVQAWLQREIDHRLAHGVQYWPCFAAEDGALTGCAGLRVRDAAGGVFELGIHLRPMCWGRGLALEAGRAVVEHAAGLTSVRTLVAGHHPENVASAKLLARAGFHRIGSELYPPTGLQHPLYRVSL